MASFIRVTRTGEWSLRQQGIAVRAILGTRDEALPAQLKTAMDISLALRLSVVRH
jgi:hypothetical protein